MVVSERYLRGVLMTSREHNRLIGILLMAHGGLQALSIVMICIIYAVIGSAIMVGGRGNDRIVGLFFIAMVFAVVVVSLLFILPQLIGGYKIWKEKPGARNWGLAGSITSLLSFPFGTAVGVYGLWFLFGEVGKDFYLGGTPQQIITADPEPPPPNSWQ